MPDSYLDRLLLELRLRDVPGQRIGEVIAEVETHVAESGESPSDAFGPPEEYALAIATAAGVRPRRRAWWRAWLAAAPTALGSLLCVDGLSGIAAGDPGRLTPGIIVATALLPFAASALIDVVVRTERRRLGWLLQWLAGLVAVGIFAVGLLWQMPELLRFPAWVGATLGGVLLIGGLVGVLLTRADPVIDPRRADSTRVPLRAVLVPVGLTVLMIVLLLVFTALIDRR